MRSSTFSSLAILASLLVKEVFAGRYDVRKRDLYVVTDSVIVTEQIIVTEAADGSFATGAPEAIATVTIDGIPVLVPASTSAAPTIAPTTSTIPIAAPTTTSSTSLGAILIQESSSAAPVPTTSTNPVVIIPATTSIPPVVVPTTTPTTLATVVSSAAPVSTGSTTSGSKRGVAYNTASLLSGFSGSQVSWAYNWGDTPSGLTGFEYVPMLWGLGSHLNGWTAAATAAIAAGSTAILTFNEPDLSSQSNLDYQTAAQGFMDNVQQFAGKALLGAPAVTNGGAPMGLTYMENFLGACKTLGCTIDFVCIHWYNGGTADDFKTYVQNAYTQSGNLPVWITEFQAPGDTAEQIAFLQEVIPWLDSQSFVQKYAYFMASDGILLSAGSALSTLGETFASYE